MIRAWLVRCFNYSFVWCFIVIIHVTHFKFHVQMSDGFNMHSMFYLMDADYCLNLRDFDPHHMGGTFIIKTSIQSPPPNQNTCQSAPWPIIAWINLKHSLFVFTNNNFIHEKFKAFCFIRFSPWIYNLYIWTNPPPQSDLQTKRHASMTLKIQWNWSLLYNKLSYLCFSEG